MRIRYEVTVEDMVAFQEYCYSRSPLTRRQLKVSKWCNAAVIAASGIIYPTVYPLMPAIVGGSLTAYAVSLFVSSIVGAGYVLLYPGMVRRRIRRFAQKYYREGDHRTILGEHELELQENGFVERTQYNENKTAWGALEKIESAPGYTFLFVGTALAYVVPHRSVTQGDLKDFLTELGTRFKPDALLQPTGITPAG